MWPKWLCCDLCNAITVYQTQRAHSLPKRQQQQLLVWPMKCRQSHGDIQVRERMKRAIPSLQPQRLGSNAHHTAHAHGAVGCMKQWRDKLATTLLNCDLWPSRTKCRTVCPNHLHCCVNAQQVPSLKCVFTQPLRCRSYCRTASSVTTTSLAKFTRQLYRNHTFW